MYMVLGVLLTLTTLVGSAHAQSKDRDNPTRLTSNEISGVIGGNLGNDYYYTFVAGPGELTITVTVEPGRDAGISFNTMRFDLFDEDARQLTGKSQSAGSGHTEQGVVRLQLGRRQRLLLRVSIPESNHGMGTGKYRLRLSGSVETNTPTATGSGVNVADLKLFDDANSGAKGNCLPKTGTLIVKMKDGSKRIIDLSEAATVTIVP
jgi:hypothetical protein